jgi:hypothetical protein
MSIISITHGETSATLREQLERNILNRTVGFPKLHSDSFPR